MKGYSGSSAGFKLRKIKAGSVSNKMSGFEDWLVSFHELIEAKAPLSSYHDGRSLVPIYWENLRVNENFCTVNFPDMGDSRRYGWRNGRAFGKTSSAKESIFGT